MQEETNRQRNMNMDESKLTKEQPKRRVNATMISSLIIVFLVIPLLIWMGVTLMNDRKYYLISILIILASCVPFLVKMKEKPFSSRRLILIASLSAIATLGRIAFFFMPQFKPVLAVVIMAAILLGPMDGFIVGVLTGFVSNFYFSQGPWTVWQMFCFGLVGFVAGVLFLHKRHTKLLVCLYGFIATFIIYGGIMNFASVLMFYSYVTVGALKLSYIQGIPFDLIHAVATVVFLYFIYHPFMEKITRIKLKYQI